MMGFKKFITEVFEKPVKWEFNPSGNYYTFNYNNTRYHVLIQKFFNGNYTFGYDIDLSAAKSGEMLVSNELTQLGNGQFIVLATIKDIIEHHFTKKIKLGSGDFISFYAWNKRTIPLFDKFAKYLSKKFNLKDTSMRHGYWTLEKK